VSVWEFVTRTNTHANKVQLYQMVPGTPRYKS
jgi:hypothetical protein